MVQLMKILILVDLDTIALDEELLDVTRTHLAQAYNVLLQVVATLITVTRLRI